MDGCALLLGGLFCGWLFMHSEITTHTTAAAAQPMPTYSSVLRSFSAICPCHAKYSARQAAAISKSIIPIARKAVFISFLIEDSILLWYFTTKRRMCKEPPQTCGAPYCLRPYYGKRGYRRNRSSQKPPPTQRRVCVFSCRFCAERTCRMRIPAYAQAFKHGRRMQV